MGGLRTLKLILNGQSVELGGEHISVKDLLERYDLSNKIVVVEVNEKIVDKTQYSHFTLLEGVRIELVHFVGGG